MKEHSGGCSQVKHGIIMSLSLLTFVLAACYGHSSSQQLALWLLPPHTCSCMPWHASAFWLPLSCKVAGFLFVCLQGGWLPFTESAMKLYYRQKWLRARYELTQTGYIMHGIVRLHSKLALSCYTGHLPRLILY